MGSDGMIKSTAQRQGCWQRPWTVSWLLAIWAVATLYLIYVAVSAPRETTHVDSGAAPVPLTLGIPSSGLAPDASDAVTSKKKKPSSGWVQVPLDALREMQSKYASGKGQAPLAGQGRESASRGGGSSPVAIPETGESPEAQESSRRGEKQEKKMHASEYPQERYRVPMYLAHMQSNDTWRGRHLDIVLHKGFTNQVFALLNGLAIAHLLNVTLALPKMTANYDYTVYSGMDIQRMQFDPAHKFRQRMDNFFDTAALINAVAPWVRVVEELPAHLQGDSQFGRIPATLVNPKRPETLLPYVNELRNKLVLRVKCPLSSVLWNTPELGRLRKVAVTALAPSGQVAQMVAARMHVIQRASAGWATPGFIGLHLRVESDWIEHCKSEKMHPEKTMIQSFEHCWSSAEEVSSRLVHAVQQTQQAEPRLVYVATGQYDQDFEPFQRRGFTVLSPANFSSELDTFRYEDGQTMRDLLAAVDYFILRASVLFMGNIFSSFSFSIRETFFYRGASPMESLRTFYYNDKKPSPLLDITPIEALRWRVRTGIAYPDFYTHSRQGQAYSDMACRIHAPETSSSSSMENLSYCTTPKIASLTVTSVTTTDSGYIVVAGKVKSKGIPWIFTLEAQGLPQGPMLITANEPVYKHSPEEYMFEFSFVGMPDRQNEFVICTLDGAEKECTNSQMILLKAALKRPNVVPFGLGGGTVYIYTGMSRSSGGVESLHKLNAIINSEFMKGHITMQSKIYNGHAVYRTSTSVFIDDITSRDLGPNDVFLIPERLDNLPRWWHYVLDETGALPVQYILGQHTTKLRVDRIGKDGFQPICLTSFFASTHDCPPKAVLTTSFDDSWIQTGRKYRNSYHAKENIILVDPDNTMHLDPLRIQVHGARVILLRHLPKEKVQELYQRAKINLDTYITGRERAIFEGALFNVIPVIKYHSSGTDQKVFNIPSEWRWSSWDYDQLNAQLTHLLNTYRDQVPKLKPLIDTVEGWSEEFPRQVTRYFGDNVHVMLSALGDSCDMDHERRTTAILSAVFILLQYPFATVEIITHSVYYFEYDFAGVLDLLFRRGMERRVTISQVAPEYRRLCSVAVFLQPPKAKQRRHTALLVPTGALPFESDLLTSLLSAYHHPQHCGKHGAEVECSLEGVAAEGGLLLVEQDPYYRAVDALVQRVPDQASVARLRPYIEQLPIKFREVPVSELQFFQKYEHECTRYPLCSGAIDIPSLEPALLQAMSAVCLKLCLCDNILPILGVQTMASSTMMFPGSRVVTLLRELSNLCAVTLGPHAM